jgi:spore coat polysaccharide biosynthesis predicted glycosyltransferase SpsG
MGLPSLLITLAENQHGSAQYLNRHGIATSLGWQHRVPPSEIVATLSGLIEAPGTRSEMSARGRRLIDGQGADRIVQTMASISTRG